MLLLAILIGIGVRRRTRAAGAFVGYLAVTLLSKLAHAGGAITPADWHPYLLEQVAQALLMLAVGIEIGARVFHRNVAPAGRAYTARAVLVVVLLGLTAAIAWGRRLEAARTDADVYYALVDAERRVSATTVWVFLAVFGAADMRFHWPIDPYHRDIAIGCCAYSASYYLFSPNPAVPVQFPMSWPVWLYTAILALWLRAAWRRDDFSHVAPRYRPYVFPWAKHEP